MAEVPIQRFRRLLELRDEKNAKNKAAEAAKAKHKEYQADLWADLEDSEGGKLKTITVDLGPPYGVQRFQRRATTYGRVIDLEKLLDYLENSGRVEELSQQSIREGRLNELVRECLDHGIELPEGADFYVQRYFTITKTD